VGGRSTYEFGEGVVGMEGFEGCKVRQPKRLVYMVCSEDQRTRQAHNVALVVGAMQDGQLWWLGVR
jgi:hypothetical protein